MPKSQNYIFTWNNPQVSLGELEMMAKAKGATAFIGQLEKGEEGTAHLQFFMRFASDRHFKSVKKDFPVCHIEAAKSAYDAW